MVQFESTQNGEGYSQSQLLILLEVPTEQQVSSRSSITMYASPSGQNEYTLGEEVPTEEELLAEDWTKVEIRIAVERYVTRGRLQGLRRQYTLKHRGSSTINKQMVRQVSPL